MSKIRIATIALLVPDEETDEQVAGRLQAALPDGSVTAIQVRDPDEPLNQAVLVSGLNEPVEVTVGDNLVQLRGRDGSISVEIAALVDR